MPAIPAYLLVLALAFAATPVLAAPPPPWNALAPEDIFPQFWPSDEDLYSAVRKKRKVPRKATRTLNKPTPSQSKAPGDPYALRLNVGMGPSMNFFPGALWDNQPFYTGWALDIFLSIPKEVMQSSRKAADTRFRKYIDGSSGAELRPSYLALFPSNIFFSPGVNGVGIYGINWHFAGFMASADPIQEVTLSGGIKLPAVTLLYISADDEILEESPWILGIGASIQAKSVFHLSPRAHLSTEWTSSFYLPLEQMKIQPSNSSSEKIWHIGSLALLFHYRFGMLKDL